MAEDENALTDKQEMFAKEYAVHFDSTKAALAAGYSAKSAMSQGCQLLKLPKVQKFISKQLEIYGNKNEVLKKRVLNQIVEAAFSDITDFAHIDENGVSVYDWDKLPKGMRRLISEVSETRTKDGGTIKFKLVDKMKALELLARHLGMLTDKVEHTLVKPQIIMTRDGKEIKMLPEQVKEDE